MPQLQMPSARGTWSLIGLSIIIIFVYLLANVQKCEAQVFCATEIFSFILIGSLVMILTLGLINNPSTKSAFDMAVLWFFMKGFTLKKLLYIPLGLGGVFFASYLGVSLPTTEFNRAVISIFLAGIILLYTLYKTNAIGIPIIIHGIYNSLVLYSQTIPQGNILTNILSTSPLGATPVFGLTLGAYSGITNELIFQIFLVAVAEEVLKVFIIQLIIVGFRGKFDLKYNLITWFAGLGSVGVWTVYHTIEAIR